MAEIIFQNNGENHIQLEKESYIFGRNASCDVVIHSDTVSRRHAKLQRKNNRYYLIDLGSRNGVYVNDDKIIERALVNNDRVKLGIFEMTFKDQQRHDAERTEDVTAGGQPPSQRTMILDTPMDDIIGAPARSVDRTMFQMGQFKAGAEKTFIEGENMPETAPLRQELLSSAPAGLVQEEAAAEPEAAADTRLPGVQPYVLIFLGEKVLKAHIKRARTVIGNAETANIHIAEESLGKEEAVILRQGDLCYLIDEFATGDVLHNNKPVVRRRLYDKMVFQIKGVTCQYIANKTGFAQFRESVYGTLRYLLERPLIGISLAFLFILAVVFVMVIIYS